MAITYVYRDVMQAASQRYSRSIEDLAQNYALNNAISKMWRAYDWRGTLAELPPFWLVSGQQDYGKPLYVIPPDYDGLREVYLVLLSGNNPCRFPLRIVKDLERTHVQNLPSCIAFNPAIHGFRVHPTVPYGSVACPNYLIDGIYKQKPPKIDRTMMGTPLLWDDLYFDAFVQAYIWATLRILGDMKSAIEQEGVFYETLMEATRSENLEQGEPMIAPAEPLGVIRGGQGAGYAGQGLIWR